MSMSRHCCSNNLVTVQAVAYVQKIHTLQQGRIATMYVCTYIQCVCSAHSHNVHSLTSAIELTDLVTETFGNVGVSKLQIYVETSRNFLFYRLWNLINAIGQFLGMQAGNTSKSR